MTQQPPPVPPPPLEYAAHDPSRRPKRSWGAFTAGVFFGLCISVVYYVSLGTDVGRHTPWQPLGAVILKLMAGITMLFFPRTKYLGAGLILSIPIAVLIFLGLCFAAVSSL
jgi:hypothetical protein